MRSILEKLFNSLGFQTHENIETAYDHIVSLSQKEREAIKDSYLREVIDDEVEVLAQEGLRLWRAGKAAQALAFYNQAVEKSPEDSIFLLNRAQLQLDLGNIEDAQRDFERARAGQPALPDRVFSMQRHLQKMSPEALKGFVYRRKKAHDPS